MTIAIFGIVFSLVTGALILGPGLKSIERGGRTRALSQRESFSENEIYARFYAESGLDRDRVLKAWTLVAATLHCDSGRIRPTDCLRALAGVPKWLGTLHSDLDELEYEIIRRLQSAKTSLPERYETVDDIVRFLYASTETTE